MELINQIMIYGTMFFLILARIIGMFIIAPILSSSFISNQIKIALTLMLTFIVFNFQKSYIYFDLDVYYALLIIKELSIGFSLGFVMYMYIAVFNMAGEFIDAQIGFSMVSFFDPASNTNDTITGTMYYTMAILILFTINGHHLIIEAIMHSFDILPIGTVVIKQEIYAQMIKIFVQTFGISFKIASPIVAAIFIANVTLGFLAKTVPQMNVFVVGMPLKVAMGFAMLLILMPFLIKSTNNIFQEMQGELIQILQFFGT